MRIKPGHTHEIRKAHAEDMTACGQILNDWIDATPWMPRVHTHEDVIRYHCEFVYENRAVLVARASNGQVEGFAAKSPEGCVTGFYLAKDSQGKGLGKQILDRVKQESSEGLSLWTFVANTGAQKFYRREGFEEVRRTDGNNEENLPDILFSWQPGERAA